MVSCVNYYLCKLKYNYMQFQIRKLVIMVSHLPGRPLRINFMSRYICFSQIRPFDVSFEELFSKVQNPGGIFRKIVF